MIVDAFVETSIDNGQTWQRMCDPDEDFRWFDGPWSIPNAIEVGRQCWSAFLRITSGHVLTMGVCVRVIDAAGTVVEQWPKRPREAPRIVLHADHPGYLVSGVMSEP